MFEFRDNIIYLFFGAIFSILLPTVIVYSKRELLRLNKKKELQEDAQPEKYGDLNAYLNDSYYYKKINFVNYLIEQAIQPLFILCLFELFTNNSTASVILLVILIIVMILHELFAAEVNSGKFIYRFFIVMLWIIAFGVYSYIPSKSKNVTSKIITITIDNKAVISKWEFRA